MGLSTTATDKIEEDTCPSGKGGSEKETADTNINEDNKSTREYSANVKATSVTNAVMERLLMQCSVCEQSYNDERVPRNLSCGHSLCTDCANQCLSSQKHCPECRERQLAKTASDLPINYPLRRLVRAVLNNEIDLKDITVPEVPVFIPIKDGYQDAGECPAHGSRLVFLCVSCSTWVCQDCLIVDHPYLPRGSCKILNLKEAMEEIRKEHKRNADLANTDIDYILKNLEPLIAKHNNRLKFDCCGDVRSHLRLIREIEKGLDELKMEDHATVDKTKKKLVDLSETANKTTSPEEITLSCKELMECQSNLKQYISLEKERKVSVLQDINNHMRMDLKLLVMQNVPVYAVREEKGKVRYSLITSNDDRLLMYSLSEDVPPKDSMLVPYEDILELIPLENGTIFFDVGTKDESLGLVYIKLFGDTPRTRQTRLLCTGEKGPCYKNTRFYAYDEEGGILRGGDFMNNDGTGGQAILPGVEEPYTSNAYSGSNGLVVMDNEFYSQFHIYLRYNGMYIYSVMGQVTKGLEILTDATSKIKPVTDCVIRECGLFIPMRTKDDTS